MPKDVESSEDKAQVSVLTKLTTDTLYSDHLHINARNDGMYLLRFLVELPEGLVEQTRLMVSRDRLKTMLDVTCRYIEHYPECNHQISQKSDI